MDLQFIYSLIVGAFIGGVAGYLGSLMVTKRMALVGDALGHVALPGIALALIYGFNPSWGALPALLFGILLIWFFEIHTKLPMGALTGIVFTASVAIAFLFLPENEVSAALIGDISKISLFDTIVSVILCLVVFLILKEIFSKMILTSISEDLAKVEHIDAKKYNFIFLLCIALVVALGIKITGSLLMGALVITPAAAARNSASNLFQYSFFSLIIGAVSCISGILFFKVFSLSAGPFVVLTASFIFLVSLFFRKKR